MARAFLYRFRTAGDNESKRFSELLNLLRQAAAGEIPEADTTRKRCKSALRLAASDKVRGVFRRAGGQVRPSLRSRPILEGLAETLLHLMPPMVIARSGPGEGNFSQLLAQRAKKVIAVDNSEKMVEYGAALASKARRRKSGIS